MKWKKIESAPKTGETILVCNTKQRGVLKLIRWFSVHKRWESNTGPIYNLQADYWTQIENIPGKQK